MNYFDPQNGITDDIIDKQIQSLFDEYKIQKKAYRMALSQCQLNLRRNQSHNSSAIQSRKHSIKDWPMRINATNVASLPSSEETSLILPRKRLKPKIIEEKSQKQKFDGGAVIQSQVQRPYRAQATRKSREINDVKSDHRNPGSSKRRHKSRSSTKRMLSSPPSSADLSKTPEEKE